MTSSVHLRCHHLSSQCWFILKYAQQGSLWIRWRPQSPGSLQPPFLLVGPDSKQRNQKNGFTLTLLQLSTLLNLSRDLRSSRFTPLDIFRQASSIKLNHEPQMRSSEEATWGPQTFSNTQEVKRNSNWLSSLRCHQIHDHKNCDSIVGDENDRSSWVSLSGRSLMEKFNEMNWALESTKYNWWPYPNSLVPWLSHQHWEEFEEVT